MTSRASRVAVLGAGAWGTALACTLAARMRTMLWARDPAQADALRRERCNRRYLPEIELPAALDIGADLGSAVRDAEWLIAATPVAGLRELALRLRALGTEAPLVWLCKGFEQDSGLLPHQVIAAALGAAYPCAALSGPSFALEVARGLPCALTLAAADAEFARSAAGVLHGGRVRVYYTHDLIGVEVAGAVKNVMAIAVGMCDGLNLGQSARAALITRGLAEMMRLGVGLGGAAETFMGLAGAGDLILTATGELSRNRRVGVELAAGRPVGEILAALGHVAEGVQSAREVSRLAARHGVDMPITEAVSAVLAARLAPRAAAELLLSRDPKRER